MKLKSLLKNMLKCLCCIVDHDTPNLTKNSTEKKSYHHKKASITLTQDDWEEGDAPDTESTIKNDPQSTIIGRDTIIWEADTIN